MLARTLAVALLATVLSPAIAGAQDVSKLVTKADVEKVTGARFKDGFKQMDQITFQQEGGDLQISVDVEKRDAGTSVRSWEATIRKMSPATKVETVKGVGQDAIFHSTRADMGALSADFDPPRVQLRVAVAGAKDAGQARRIVTELAKTIAPRVGK